MDKDYEWIGEYIRTLRGWKGITQEKLAEMADLSVCYISRVERGQKQIGMHAFLRILHVFGIKVEEIFPLALKEAEPPDIYFFRYKDVMADCDDAEKLFLMDMLESIKYVMRRNRRGMNLPDFDKLTVN